MKNNTFYDNISSEYDEMINLQKLIYFRRELLKKFIKSDYKSAIDIGCGTGADSIALTMNGLRVKGYDPSAKMIKKARENAKEFNTSIKFINSEFRIKSTDKDKTDIVVSLGNAFANIEQKNICKIIKNVYASLRHEGIFLFQLLNYGLIRKEKKRIVNITENGYNIFIRFYDIIKEGITFNILTIQKKDLKEHNLITTELYEHSKDFLIKELNKAGFANIALFGDFKGTNFNKQNSKDLIILAKK